MFWWRDIDDLYRRGPSGNDRGHLFAFAMPSFLLGYWCPISLCSGGDDSGDDDDIDVLGGHGDRDSGDGVDGDSSKLAEPIKEVMANFEVAESKITPLVADYIHIIHII